MNKKLSRFLPSLYRNPDNFSFVFWEKNDEIYWPLGGRGGPGWDCPPPDYGRNRCIAFSFKITYVTKYFPTPSPEDVQTLLRPCGWNSEATCVFCWCFVTYFRREWIAFGQNLTRLLGDSFWVIQNWVISFLKEHSYFSKYAVHHFDDILLKIFHAMPLWQ